MSHLSDFKFNFYKIEFKMSSHVAYKIAFT
jgi:hypothetical protein